MTSEENSPYAEDEIKTYIDEGDENDEIKKSANLSEDKKELVGDSDEEAENSARKDRNLENPFLSGTNAFQFYSSIFSSGLHSQLAQFNPNLSMYAKDRFPMPIGGLPPYGLPPAHPGFFPFYPPEMSRWAALTRFSTFPGTMPGSPLHPGSPGPSFISIPGLTPPSSSPKGPSNMESNLDGPLRVPMFSHHNGLLDANHQFFQNASFSHQKPSPKKPSIKKPLNSFMLFMKEKRSEVIAQTSVKESAAINQVLGRQWHALGRAGQQKYYDMAKKEKELHAQKYPGWSARDNYAMNSKKKKKRNQSLDRMDDNISTDSDSSRANRMNLTPKPCTSLDVLNLPDLKAT